MPHGEIQLQVGSHMSSSVKLGWLLSSPPIIVVFFIFLNPAPVWMALYEVITADATSTFYLPLFLFEVFGCNLRARLYSRGEVHVIFLVTLFLLSKCGGVRATTSMLIYCRGSFFILNAGVL